ncbi:hypothetical protein [Chondromyces apiculatus]|uniref:hypothetical protein n=1 Tax=Chondromyces apiculatus TaxID=51 RepID=UPI0018CC13AD|nr:hypothetical protein [Chondromyces apiculatus]
MNIGHHVYEVESPDLVRVKLQGDLSAEESELSVELYRQVGEQCGRVLVMIDASTVGGIPVEARKTIQAALGVPFRGFVIHGGGFMARVLIKMLLNTLKLFIPSMDMPVEFCATKGEAERWIARRRAALGPLPGASPLTS